MRISPTLGEYDFTAEVNDRIPHGDLTQVAAVLGKSASLLHQQYNPHDERSNPLWTALQHLLAIAAVNEAAESEVWQVLVASRNRGLGKNVFTVTKELCEAVAEIQGAVESARAELKEAA